LIARSFGTGLALELAGNVARIDHRSLEAQGIDRVAQIHLGLAVVEMRRRGIATERAELAGAIDTVNDELESFSAGLPASVPAIAVVDEDAASAPAAVGQEVLPAALADARERAPPRPATRIAPAGIFRKVAGELARRVKSLQPTPRRRRREDTGRSFMAATKIMRRAVTLPAVAWFLSDTLDWLNLWHGNDAGLDDGYEASAANHLSPHL
jgi:hypothetical protein